MLSALLVLATATVVAGQGAGRAIPIASENFVIELFRSINPSISYDTTNFLVDLSGNFANCNFIGRRQHTRVDEWKWESESIGLIQDYTFGTDVHTEAVDGYLRPVFEGWVRDNSVGGAYEQIRAASRFGCSVRPGCDGQLSMACLFTPYTYGNPQPPTRRPTRPTTTTTTTRRPPNPITGVQRARAFTREQYAEAQQLTEQVWDGSHFLENLSGFETTCNMVGRTYHEFSYATYEAGVRGKEVVGLFGSAPNLGSTPAALLDILDNMKQATQTDAELARLVGYFDASAAANAKDVGCSLIPDCILGGQMYVVVSCIFEV